MKFLRSLFRFLFMLTREQKKSIDCLRKCILCNKRIICIYWNVDLQIQISLHDSTNLHRQQKRMDENTSYIYNKKIKQNKKKFKRQKHGILNVYSFCSNCSIFKCIKYVLTYRAWRITKPTSLIWKTKKTKTPTTTTKRIYGKMNNRDGMLLSLRLSTMQSLVWNANRNIYVIPIIRNNNRKEFSFIGITINYLMVSIAWVS